MHGLCPSCGACPATHYIDVVAKISQIFEMMMNVTIFAKVYFRFM